MPKPMTADRLNEICAFEPATATPQQIGAVLLELTNEVQRLRDQAVGTAERNVRETIATQLESRIHTWEGMSDQAIASNETFTQAARIARSKP